MEAPAVAGWGRADGSVDDVEGLGEPVVDAATPSLNTQRPSLTPPLLMGRLALLPAAPACQSSLSLTPNHDASDASKRRSEVAMMALPLQSFRKVVNHLGDEGTAAGARAGVGVGVGVGAVTGGGDG